MPTLSYRGKQFHLFEDESVLEGLLRAGEEVAHGCKNGVCKSCTMVCMAGSLPEAAQQGLRPREIRTGLFLACRCVPGEDLEIRDCGDEDLSDAQIVEHERLTRSVVRVRIRPKQPLDYAAGQSLAVRRGDGLTRTFSLASLPSQPYLELHVERMADGQMSAWLYELAQVGTPLQLKQAHGQCYYPPEELDAPLLLVGTKTGFGPVWGILRAALDAGHRGPITVFQAGDEPSDLYMCEELDALAANTPTLRVRRCVRRAPEGGGEGLEVEGIEVGAIDELVLAFASEHASPEYLTFLCGEPELVKRLRMRLFMGGMAARRIFADAFLRAKSTG